MSWPPDGAWCLTLEQANASVLAQVAELLGIATGWMVCSNGAVTVRLDPALPQGWELDEVRTFEFTPDRCRSLRNVCVSLASSRA